MSVFFLSEWLMKTKDKDRQWQGWSTHPTTVLILAPNPKGCQSHLALRRAHCLRRSPLMTDVSWLSTKTSSSAPAAVATLRLWHLQLLSLFSSSSKIPALQLPLYISRTWTPQQPLQSSSCPAPPGAIASTSLTEALSSIHPLQAHFLLQPLLNAPLHSSLLLRFKILEYHGHRYLINDLE